MSRRQAGVAGGLGIVLSVLAGFGGAVALVAGLGVFAVRMLKGRKS